MSLSTESIAYGLGIIGLVSAIFTVYNSYKNPQIKTDRTTDELKNDIENLKLVVNEIKEKHLASVEENIRSLSKTINDLSLTVTRLTTIIEERVPKSIRKK